MKNDDNRLVFLLVLSSVKNPNIGKLTLFRYVYLVQTVINFLAEKEVLENSRTIIDKNLWITNQQQMNASLNYYVANDYCTLEGSIITIDHSKIDSYLGRLESKIVSEESLLINGIINILTQYPDDVILAFFANDPNIEDSFKRNSKSFDLKKGRLYSLLREFQELAKDKNLDRYDVFLTWLDFIQDKYYGGKEYDEEIE